MNNLLAIVALSFVVLASTLGCAAAATKDEFHVTVSAAELVADKVRESIEFSAAHPVTTNDPAQLRQLVSIDGLIMAFYHFNSASDLATLVSLGRLRLGEGPTTLYRCVVLSKGARIRAELQRENDRQMRETGRTLEATRTMLAGIDKGEKCSSADL
jgi:hypothetical protein